MTQRHYTAMSDTNQLSVNRGESFEALAERLTRVFGAVVGGEELSRALGYRTQGAFRQAAVRKRLPIPVFTYEGRRGRHAHTADIARWLWSQRSAVNRDPFSASVNEETPRKA